MDPYAQSNAVIKRAFMIAKEKGAELFIVYAVKIPWFETPDFFSLKYKFIDTDVIRKDIQKKIKRLKLPNGVDYTVFVKEGDPEDTVLYQAKLVNADMIIIGAHTKTKKALVGTTAHKIVHRSHLPVLVVKNRSKEPYKRVTVLTDFGTNSKLGAAYAKKAFPDSKMEILHAYEAFYATGIYTTIQGLDTEQYRKNVKSSAKEKLKALQVDLGVEKSKLIDGGVEVRKTLLGHLKKNPCDLMVVGSRGTSGIQTLLGSIASYMLAEAPCDVLLYVANE